MFKKIHKIRVIDSLTWSDLYIYESEIVPRKDELIVVDKTYYSVVNLIHDLDNKSYLCCIKKITNEDKERNTSS